MIAEKLHKTVGEVRSMPNDEFEYWQDFIRVQSTLAELKAKTEANRGDGH